MKYRSLLVGLGIGAGVMFLLDPRAGRYRRNRLRKKVTTPVRDFTHSIAGAAHDVSNRVRGIAVETAARLKTEEVADEVLEARVRSKLGHVIPHSHVHDITIATTDGTVTLGGRLPSNEIVDVVTAIGRVRGVTEVVNTIAPTDAAAARA